LQRKESNLIFFNFCDSDNFSNLRLVLYVPQLELTTHCIDVAGVARNFFIKTRKLETETKTKTVTPWFQDTNRQTIFKVFRKMDNKYF